jgi:hypothetical protein
MLFATLTMYTNKLHVKTCRVLSNLTLSSTRGALPRHSQCTHSVYTLHVRKHCTVATLKLLANTQTMRNCVQ